MADTNSIDPAPTDFESKSNVPDNSLPLKSTAGRPAGSGGPTKEITERIALTIKAGNFFETACELVGVPTATAYEWIARGEGRSKRRPSYENYAYFADTIRQANAHAEAFAVQQCRMAGKDDWRYWQTFLARRFGANWAPNVMKDIARKLSGMSDDSIQSTLSMLINGETTERSEGEPKTRGGKTSGGSSASETVDPTTGATDDGM